MSEQKYYVKIRQEVFIADRCGHGGTICHTWISEDYYFSEELFRQSFTKSELAEIMNGGLYKEIKGLAEYEADTLVDSKTGWSYTDEIITDIEWVNPLIELVPVEEE